MSLRILPLLGLSLLFVACGGGSGGISLGDAIDDNRALTHPDDDDDLRGNIRNGVSVSPIFVQNYVGDSATTPESTWRSTAGFNLHAPRAGTTLARATLRLRINEVRGFIRPLGALLVQSIDMEDVLDAGDYSSAAFRTTVVANNELVEGDLLIDVTSLVRNAYTRGTQDMDFRFQFVAARVNNGENDGILFRVSDLHLVWE